MHFKRSNFKQYLEGVNECVSVCAWVISSVAMSCHAMSCHVMSCHVMSCHVMPWHVSHVASRRVVSCHVVSCHVVSCCPFALVAFVALFTLFVYFALVVVNLRTQLIIRFETPPTLYKRLQLE